jgi:hypothetical protein
MAIDLAAIAATTRQPLLQARALAIAEGESLLAQAKLNPYVHPTVQAVIALDSASRDKLLKQAIRLHALLARLPLVLPEQGHHVRFR